MPRFLWSHNYSMPPLGTALSVKKTADALVFQIKFASPEEYGGEWPANMPTPGTIYNLYCSGHLNATSVGFQGLEAEPILGKADDQGYRPRTGTRYIKQELYELSAVTVPANPEALIVNAVQKGIISEEEGQRFREACADPPPLSELDQRLITLGLDPAGDDSDKTILALCDLVEDLQSQLSQKVRLEVSMPPLSDEQMTKLQAAFEKAIEKAGAVLNAKNKEFLTQARDLISQVLAAAEGSASDGKGATPKQSIYSLALNPGPEPHGGRPAGESIDMGEILALTKGLHQSVCPAD